MSILTTASSMIHSFPSLSTRWISDIGRLWRTWPETHRCVTVRETETHSCVTVRETETQRGERVRKIVAFMAKDPQVTERDTEEGAGVAERKRERQ